MKLTHGHTTAEKLLVLRLQDMLTDPYLKEAEKVCAGLFYECVESKGRRADQNGREYIQA